ncbi:alpha/beta hydrolase-fold protein [Lutibacter sp. TH_r2]|uniref:alpha/beta hydrolase n=1 Tax=Lutibacter sp. TH_r2 TaxID=3082083 RepID=UPI002954B9F7|nr:alpha/beta fold hydrolase [Lutibacter sp. TH_r2]MDV7188129.1 alpha/beta hydrolase-fold protein [Lutibacter sp. TH_r2]
MEKLSLEYLVQEPNEINEQTNLLILVHGYGSNEEDLFSFAAELPENLIIVSTRAPRTLGFGSYSWYTINMDNSGGKFSNDEEAIESRDLISKFISEIQERYAKTPKQTFLLGFSQGCILSIAVALSYPEKIQKVIGLSGYANFEILPDNYNNPLYANLDFFLSHGSVDQVLPVEWARQTDEFLTQIEVKHSYQEYPVGHGVAPQNFFAFKKWIEERM